MVVKDKYTGGIIICVDLRNMNDVCLRDPFPNPFKNEVLENVGGRNHTHSPMDYRDTIRLVSHHKIDIRRPLQ